MKRILIPMMIAAVISCQSEGNDYKSVEDYPVRTGTLEELDYSSKASVFTLWAPTAESVTLRLYYESYGETEAVRTVAMKRGKEGTWKCRVRGNQEGRFYTFQVTVDGKILEETPGINARAVGLNGKRAAVIDMRKTDPEGWENDIRPELESLSDVIVYEAHFRDQSMDADSGIANKGKFLQYTEEGTVTSWGDASGVDHLKELGITHLQIQPSYDYGSVDESRLDDNVYNWGYDPQNYNVPEGSYSTDPSDPYCRIREFKQMVQSLHRNGIRVIMDVVYNHTFNTVHSPFENTVPGYFYRMREDGTFSDGSGCGNETASDREMYRKYMIESVLYWITEYHVDGFRFDLMAIHDIETMNLICEAVDAVDPGIVLYGEGWSAGTCMIPQETQALKANMMEIPGVGAFGDELRDAVRGPFSDDSVGAFLIGKSGNEESIKFGIAGAIEHPQISYDKVNYSQQAWALQPTQMIAYVSCHDDMCMRDRMTMTMPGADDDEIIRAIKLAQTMVLTSQGMPFIYSGEELFRDKKLVHNSFNSPDEINTIEWRNKSEHRDLFEYIRNLIALRKAHPAFHMGDADMVRKYLEFLPVKTGNAVAFILDGNAAGDSWTDIFVAFNSGKKALELTVPEGSYTVVCKNGVVAEEGIETVSGDRLVIPAMSALIAHKD